MKNLCLILILALLSLITGCGNGATPLTATSPLSLTPEVDVQTQGSASTRPQLPPDLEQSVHSQVNAYYTRQMTWGPYFDEVLDIQVIWGRHPQLSEADKQALYGVEDLWCLRVRVVGRQHGPIQTETLEWIAETWPGGGEWLLMSVEMFSYPQPWMEVCGFEH